MMKSVITLSDRAHAAGIARKAGQMDIEKYWLEGMDLHVIGVAQHELEQAAAGYDHSLAAAELEREQFKAERAAAVAAIKVTTDSGHTFDGDERSQGRMARAILGLQAAPAGTLVTWVLADNAVVQVSLEELCEALQLAGLEQTRLWVMQDGGSNG